LPRPAARRSSTLRLGGALVAALSLFACAPEVEPPARLVLEAVSYDDLEGWREDDQAQALAALARSCARLGPLAEARSLGAGGIAGSVGDWRAICAGLASVPAADAVAARGFFEYWFTPFAAADNDAAEGLFTGYYEPSLKGALAPSQRYATPLLARPGDLVMVELGDFRADLAGERIAGRVVEGRLDPYPSRAEIRAGALSGRGLEIAWVEDPIDAFVLHIQGSGRVELDGGGVLRVGYAAQNGHPYTAIGRVLVDEGELTRDEVSMQAIRAWLEAHPQQAQALMDHNASYVFFRRLDGDGPLGAQGAALTPGRSLAVDRRFVPLSVPVWVETTVPRADGAGERPLRRLLIAQDTGGAVRGPVRGDVFWGNGTEAAAIAGRMRSRGRTFLLLPRAVAARGLDAGQARR
jgi:membrane-bound lytic murein transglycosylase A